MMVVRGIRLAAAGIASAPRSLAGTRAVAPRCCNCVPVRRAAPGETLACIGDAYAVAPGRALAVAMGCYRLGVLAGIRRSRLAALAYGGLLYYPTPRQSLSHKGAAFIYTRIASELACQDREVQAGSVSIDTRSLAFINYRALLAKVGDTAPGQESALPYGTSALLASS